jgi:hypothetical protein
MREPCNKARGETVLAIDGRSVRLCVTLGALAELEAAFDVVSLSELGERLSQLTASDLITVISALVTGAGEAMTPAQVAAARIDAKEAARAVATAFQAAFDGG